MPSRARKWRARTHSCVHQRSRSAFEILREGERLRIQAGGGSPIRAGGGSPIRIGGRRRQAGGRAIRIGWRSPSDSNR
eukprot:2529072-Pleurochrysis_carterae.AAC.1